MKKFLSLFMVVLVTAFVAKADLWLIGNLSPDGWVTNKGVQFTAVDENNYTLDIEVAEAGQKWYSVTTQLTEAADDWDGLRPYRFGGGFEVTLDTEVVLTPAEDNSPWTNFEVGTYTITFNVETATIKVVAKTEPVEPPTPVVTYCIRGSADEMWEVVNEFEMAEQEDGTFATEEVAIPAGFQFKVVKGVATEVIEDVEETWYGAAESDGDFWVTPETLNIEIGMTEGGENLFFESEGNFSFKFDPENMKLVVSGEFTQSGVEDLMAGKPVASTRYVNVAGQMSDKPFSGMNIVVTTYNDGTTSTTKVIK